MRLVVDADFGPMNEEMAALAKRAIAEELAPKIGQSALEDMVKSFEAERDPDGVGWLPLSEPYGSRKAKTHPGRKKLQRDLDLWQSINFRVEGATAHVGALASQGAPVYAGIHNFGGQRIPRREYVGVSEEWITGLEEAIAVYVTEGEWTL